MIFCKKKNFAQKYIGMIMVVGFKCEASEIQLIAKHLKCFLILNKTFSLEIAKKQAHFY